MSKVLLALEGLTYVEPPVLVMVKVLLKLADKSMVTDSRLPQVGLNCVRPNCLGACWAQSVAPETELVKDIVSACARELSPSNKAAVTEMMPVVFVNCFIIKIISQTTHYYLYLFSEKFKLSQIDVNKKSK
jgi:hypothetical protein